MRMLSISVGAAALAIVLAACPGGDITPGGRCDQIGSRHTNSNGYSYTCEYNTTHKFNWWVQDQPLTPERP